MIYNPARLGSNTMSIPDSTLRSMMFKPPMNYARLCRAVAIKNMKLILDRSGLKTQNRQLSDSDHFKQRMLTFPGWRAALKYCKSRWRYIPIAYIHVWNAWFSPIFEVFLCLNKENTDKLDYLDLYHFFFPSSDGNCAMNFQEQ